MASTIAMEIQIRLSQRQAPDEIAKVIGVPLEKVRKVELICRFLQGRDDCDQLCKELGIAANSLDALSDQFIEDKMSEIWQAGNGGIADGDKNHIRALVDVEQGRAALDPKNKDLQAFAMKLHSFEMTAKNRIVSAIAAKDPVLQARLDKARQDDKVIENEINRNDKFR
jgi:hypothetical protein